jgi:inner membrane transporter RhtA
VFWAAYILLSARVGQVFSGNDGLALAMLVAVVPLAPIGIAQGGSDLLVPWIIGVGAVAGMLSSAIPYTLELEALRRLPERVFGILMALEPCAAALAGLVVLGQSLGGAELLGIALVAIAGAGATAG